MGEDEGKTAGAGGRMLRLLAGVALVFEGGRHLFGTSRPLVLATGGVVVAELAFYSVLHLIISRYFERVNAWLGSVLAVAPVAAVFLLTDAAGRLGTLLFVGLSLLLAAVRADGGCEVMTVPGIAFGKRTHLVCIAFSPIDWLEGRMAKGRSVTSNWAETRNDVGSE